MAIKHFELRMSDELHEALRALSYHEHTSMNKLIIAAIEADKGVRLELKRMEK